jgi:hypothetical protein
MTKDNLIEAVFLAVLLFAAPSCKKDIGGCLDPIARNYNPEADFDNGRCEYDCNCGYIVDDPHGGGNYSLIVRNICSNRTQNFTVNYSTWLTGFIGEYICFTNVGSW